MTRKYRGIVAIQSAFKCQVVKREDKTMKFYKSEIERAYRVLGAEGWCQNARDIKSWLENGLINEKQANELRTHNNRMEREFY